MAGIGSQVVEGKIHGEVPSFDLNLPQTPNCILIRTVVIELRKRKTWTNCENYYNFFFNWYAGLFSYNICCAKITLKDTKSKN